MTLKVKGLAVIVRHFTSKSISKLTWSSFWRLYSLQIPLLEDILKKEDQRLSNCSWMSAQTIIKCIGTVDIIVKIPITSPPYTAVVELSMVVLMGIPSLFTIITPDTFRVVWTHDKRYSLIVSGKYLDSVEDFINCCGDLLSPRCWWTTWLLPRPLHSDQKVSRGFLLLIVFFVAPVKSSSPSWNLS